MKHYGDITKLSGYDLPVVDVITGGSPCQDLSVAGKRAGLDGERSGLFMDQIRIVKEMRKRDSDSGRTGQFVRPRYMVWENVPGAFSSGKPKGADFRAVLEEIVHIVCKEAPPVPIPKDGWPKAGCISGVGDSGDAFSVSWRLHDAQFWGVPQRRKRIALVADFGGLSAPEILFERRGLSAVHESISAQCQGLSRDPEPGRAAREEAAGATASGAGITGQLNDWCAAVNESARHQQDLIQHDQGVARTIVPGTHASGSHLTKTLITGGVKSANVGRWTIDEKMGNTYCHYELANTLGARDYKQPQATISFQERAGKPGGGKGILIQHEHVRMPDKDNFNAVMCFQNTGHGWWNESDVGATIRTPCGGDSVKANLVATPDVAHTLKAKANLQFREDSETYPVQNAVVRRLTPDECAALQGFPRDWCNIGEWVDSKGKKHKDADSPKYKAYGNSIALPFWQYLARRICAQYERNITMGSLFDGIGGFPLVFERCGAKAVWASEIEEFPIAVTKKHFPESMEDE